MEPGMHLPAPSRVADAARCRVAGHWDTPAIDFAHATPSSSGNSDKERNGVRFTYRQAG